MDLNKYDKNFRRKGRDYKKTGVRIGLKNGLEEKSYKIGLFG